MAAQTLLAWGSECLLRLPSRRLGAGNVEAPGASEHRKGEVGPPRPARAGSRSALLLKFRIVFCEALRRGCKPTDSM